MNKTVCQRRCVIQFVAMSALGLALIGCKTDRAAAPAGAPRVENLRQQALADQIAPGREVIVSSVVIPPYATGEWHWHPSETFHYYAEGRIEIEYNDGRTTIGTPGHVGHVPYRAMHRAVTGEEGARIIIFRVHEAGKPVRYLEEDAR